MQMIKGESSNWLNEHFFEKTEGEDMLSRAVDAHKGQNKHWDKYLDNVDKFNWQDGYGALSVSPQNVGNTIKYVFNQEQHHIEKTLKEELKVFRFYADMKNELS